MSLEERIRALTGELHSDNTETESQDEAPAADKLQHRHSTEGGERDDDDRMSLSSISSGEEKLEVNAPIPAPEPQVPPVAAVPPFPPPPAFLDFSKPPPMLLGPWSQSQPFPYNNAFHNNFVNAASQMDVAGMTAAEEEREQVFQNVLERVVSELKVVMQKDMCRRMVESSAFKSFDCWWSTEEEKSKTQVGAMERLALGKSLHV